jgi:predicted RNA-binding protein Jag
MTDPITLERAELAQFVRNTADQAITETLNELGIKRKPFEPWISENQASKLIGRKRLQTSIQKGLVKSKVNMEKRTHSKFVLKSDIQKLLNNPLR